MQPQIHLSYLMIRYFRFILLFLVQGTFAQLPLRHIAEANYTHNQFMIGSSSGTPQMSTQSQVILDREYNYVTPTNEFKQPYIHPNPGPEYRWERCDEWVSSCKKNGQVIRMHSPISPQCSDYVQDDTRTGKELATIMTEYMTALCKRYNGVEHILWMDVVNETIDKEGAWFGPKPGIDAWENPWTQIGFDNSVDLSPPIYIDSAFAIANLYAPNIKQMINQHGAFEELTWTKMKELVAYLRNKGRRIDGIGWQAHIDLGWEKIPGNMERLSNMIDWCHANDLAFHITEFNVWLKGANTGKFNEQAETFGKIVELVRLKSNNGPTGINFWQVSNIDSKHHERDGSLFDSKHQPKAAYYAVHKALNLCQSNEEDYPILNAGFEDGVHSHWQIKTFGGSKAQYSNSIDARSCNNACQINVSEVASDLNIGKVSLEQSIPLSTHPYQTIKTHIYIKGPPESKVRIQLLFTLNDGTKQYRSSEAIALNDNYQAFSAKIVAPANAREYLFRVQVGEHAGSYFIDDVSVTSPTLRVQNTSHKFKIFPIPAKNNLHIQGLTAFSMVKIFTIDGTLCYQQNNTQSPLKIDLSLWQKGPYLLRINQQNELFQRKFIIL